MATLTGLAGDDSLVGAGDNDVFDLFQGGNDTAEGRGGDDRFNFGATFGAGDHVDGGLGFLDALWLDGDYSAGLTITGAMLTEVEYIHLVAGFGYDITLAADAATGDDHLIFYAYGPVSIDGSALVDTRV